MPAVNELHEYSQAAQRAAFLAAQKETNYRMDGDGYADRLATILHAATGMYDLDRYIGELVAHADKPVRIGDFGGGVTGRFLAGQKEMHPWLECHLLEARMPNVHADIDVQIGDVQEVASMYPANFFTLVTMRNVLQFVGDPMETMRQVSVVMRPGGLALINNVPLETLFPDTEERAQAMGHLADLGWVFARCAGSYDAAFIKPEQESHPWPFVPTGIVFTHVNPGGIPRPHQYATYSIQI